MPGSSRRHSTTPEYTCRDSSSSTSDRRHSTSSDTSLPDSSHFRQLSQENIEYIPTRMKQVTASKPAANPLQFVKVGPCGLYRSAQEQLKKVEEVKKMKHQVKEEAEDWQLNLDSWKSSRRKRQEHIIERVVEVKKLELEEFDRNRRRSKTFNEMMEERNSRGRKVSLVMYKEEDANDLSDLGIGTSSGKSSICGDYGNDDTQSTSDREEMEKHPYENHNGSQGKNGMNGHREDRSDSLTTSSPEPEEYTYERAIQSYVDFTATRVKSKAADRKSLSSSREELDEVSKLSNGYSAKSPPPPPVKPRRESNPKIEGRLTGLEERRRSSADLNSIPDSSRLLPLPKVDVLKRRELFEKASESSEVTPKIPTRKSGLSTTQTIKERLSNLEKQTDTSSNPPKGNSRISATEISSSLKERLSSLQKQKSNDNLLEKDTVKDNHRVSCGDISSSQSIRTRLSQLEKQKSSENENEPVSPNRQPGDFSHSIKERLSNLDAACHKENAKRVTPDRDPSFSNKLANFRNTESLPQGDEQSDKNEKTITVESERSASPDDVELYPSKRQQFHRSLDSLDVDSSNDVVNEAFERVQSLEDLDCCNRARNYPASASSTEMLAFSSQSGDTDREDSGIHTADVSCSVSQADEPVEDGEIITAVTSVVPHFELDKSGRDSYHLEVEIVSHKTQGSGISEQLSPIPQEDPSETCTMAFCHIENNLNNSSSVPEDKNVLQHSMDSNVTSTQADISCDVSSQIPDISVTVVGKCDPSPNILVHEGSDTPSLVSSKCEFDGGGAECVTEQTSASPVGVEEDYSSYVTNQSTVPVIGEETNKLCLSVEDGVAGRECLTPSSGDGDKEFLSEEDITTSVIQSSEISSCSCTSIVMSPVESVLCSPDSPLKFLSEDLENIQSNSTSPSSATNISPIDSLVSSVANAPLPSSQTSEFFPNLCSAEPLASPNGSVYSHENVLESSAEISSKPDEEISETLTDFHSPKTDNIISCSQDQESYGDTEAVHDNTNCMLELVVEAHSSVSPINSLVEVNSTATGSLPSTNSIVSTPDISPAKETVLDLMETEINMSDHSNSVVAVVVDKPSNSECAQNQSEESQSYSELVIPEVVDSLTVGGDAEKPASSPEEGEFIANICPTSDEEELGEEVVEVCLRIKIPDVALAEKRKTVVEVCEKVDVTQIPGGLKSPPPTPFISVPSFVQVPAAMPLEEEVSKSSIEDTKDSPEREIFYSAFEVLDDKIKESESLVQDGGAPVQETPIQKETIQPVLQAKPIAPPRITQKSDESEVFLPISSQIPPLSLSGDIEILSGLSFPLGPPTSAEPPKEKPPPPPTEASDEEAPLPLALESGLTSQESPLRRLDSTKRIKKEIRRKRSDFLGIEGKTDDDSYLEPELQVSRPPDINSFLVEERRLEQQLYRQSICSESDSNLGETTESRDSGVELERGHSDDNWSTKQPLTPDVLSAEHSRQNSELYGNASITSEEDEITKKEREIIEILEKEEQWRYGNNKLNQQDSIGEKLAEKLRQLEQEKMRLEWERTEEANRRQAEANARREEELRLRAKEEELRQQERVSPTKQSAQDEKEEVKASGENLRSERERLQQEQEALLRQKESLQAQVLHQHQRWSSQSALPSQQWDAAPLPTHLSLQDVSNVVDYPSPTTSPPARPPEPLNYRLSLPDLQQDPQCGIAVTSSGQNLRPSPARRAPPPIPPSKPLRVVSQEQRERDNSIRSSRMPSADSLPHQVEPAHAHHNSVPVQVSSSQQMTRQTLQALSAVPRSRLINNDTWIQPKKKPESQRNTLNNQHWLIQEAEHRRITEQHQRNATSPRKTLPPQYWAQQQKQPQQVPQRQDKPLPDSIIQTLTQRVQNRGTLGENKKVSNRTRTEDSPSRDNPATGHYNAGANNPPLGSGDSQEKMLSVSGKKKCSHCGDELGRGAAMIIESLRLFYHIDCFKCCVCHVQLGDGLMGTDVRVRNNKLHCHNCYSSDDGVKFSCV